MGMTCLDSKVWYRHLFFLSRHFISNICFIHLPIFLLLFLLLDYDLVYFYLFIYVCNLLMLL